MSTYFVNTGCQKEFALCFISISITLTFEFRWFPAKKSGAMLLWSPVLQFYFYMSCYVHISLLGGYSSLVSEASSWLCKSIMTCQLFKFSWIKFEQRRHALSCQYPGRESKDDLPGHWSQVTEKGHNLVTDYYSPLREQGTKKEQTWQLENFENFDVEGPSEHNLSHSWFPPFVENIWCFLVPCSLRGL